MKDNHILFLMKEENEMKKIFLNETWVDDDGFKYTDKFECYLLDKLPQERDYFDYGNDKGYVILMNEDEIIEKDYKKYTLYYEKNLYDWNNQIIDVPEVCSICVRK